MKHTVKKIAAFVGITTVLELTAGWVFYEAFLNSREYKGMTLKQATKHASDRGLELRVVQQPNKKPPIHQRQTGRVNVVLEDGLVVSAKEY